MIENQLWWKENEGEGRGFSQIPPPYNHNYGPTPVTKEQEEETKDLKYGKQDRCKGTGSDGVGPSTTSVNDSNVSTSCAEKLVVKE